MIGGRKITQVERKKILPLRGGFFFGRELNYSNRMRPGRGGFLRRGLALNEDRQAQFHRDGYVVQGGRAEVRLENAVDRSRVYRGVH